MSRLPYRAGLLFALGGFGATAAMASGGHGEPTGVPWVSIGFHVFNLAVLLGLIYWAARRPVSEALSDRAAEVRRALVQAREANDAARREYESLQARVEGFESEVEQMREDTRAAAEHERKVLVERAEREAESIRSSARRTIQDETRRARRDLRQQAVRLAVELAEETLSRKVSTDDQRRLARELLRTVGRDREAGQDGGH